MVDLGGGALSYERGTPVGPLREQLGVLWGLQGYLAYKKQPPRRTLQ